MTKNTIISLAVVGIVIMLGALFFLRQGGTITPNVVPETESPRDLAGAQQNTSDILSSPGIFHGSLRELVLRGGEYKCTFSYHGPTAVSDGTVYIAGERVSGEFSTKVPQVPTAIISKLILKDGSAYSWSSVMPNNGFKTSFEKMLDDNIAPSVESATYDYHQQVDYKCEKFTIDETIFAVPEHISFMEIK